MITVTVHFRYCPFQNNDYKIIKYGENGKSRNTMKKDLLELLQSKGVNSL